MSPGDTQTVSLSGPAELDRPDTVTLDCHQSGESPGADLQVKDIDLGAVEVDALH